jgi:hypothetical protein
MQPLSRHLQCLRHCTAFSAIGPDGNRRLFVRSPAAIFHCGLRGFSKAAIEPGHATLA